MEDYTNKLRLMKEIKNRILISGRTSNHELAEEIARRWVRN